MGRDVHGAMASVVVLAATCAHAAAQRPSVLSFGFLAAFAIERVHEGGGRGTGGMTSTQRDAWWSVVGLSAFVLLGNCATQAAYVTFGPSWPRQAWQGNVLRYVGFGKLDGAIDYALFFLPYFGIALAAASKLYVDRAREEAGIDGVGAFDDKDGSPRTIIKVTVASAAVAAVTVPSVSSLMYLLFVMAYFVSEMRRVGVHLPRSGAGRLKGVRERLLNLPKVATVGCLCYTAIHFMAVYMYQLPELQSSARQSSAQLLGLYSMDKSEGPLARFMRLTQIIAIGTLFMGLCAVQSSDIRQDVEVDDDMSRPLMEGESLSDADNAIEFDDMGIVRRVGARFGGILVGFALLFTSLLVVNIAAYPMLLLGLMLVVSPARHSTFANIHGPFIFMYVSVWSVCEYMLLCIPPVMLASMYAKIRVLLEVFGALPAHDGEQSGLNALYMGSLIATLSFVAWITKLARETPTDDELEQRVQSGLVADYIPLDDLEIEYSPAVRDRQTWDVPLVQLISHLLVPFTLWIVALSRADLLHAALLLAFLFTIAKPGDRTVLHLTAQALAGIVAVLYVWVMNEHLNIFNVQRAEWKTMFGIIGLEHSSTIRAAGPFACILVVICIVLYLPKILNALTPEDDEDGTTIQGLTNSLISLGKAIVYEMSLVCVKAVTRFGSYLILLVGLITLETSECSLINLALLALLGLTCIVRRHSENDPKRWRVVLMFCLFNLAGRYAFGAFPLYRLFGFSDELNAFLENTVGLAQNLKTGKLMSELTGPSTLLVVTYFHDIGALNYRDTAEERSRLPLASTELGFFPLLKRAVILHANKVVTICAIIFSLERLDLLGMFMLAALIAASLSMKTTDGPTEVIGTVALITAIIDYAYKIQWLQQGDHASIFTLLGAHKWPESTSSFIPQNESLLRYPILVIFSVELTKTTRVWLRNLPPALKSGCTPEPCHLFWPQRDTRELLMKKKADLIEKVESESDAANEEGIDEASDNESDVSERSGSTASKGSQEFKKRIQRNARTNAGQLMMLVSLAPEILEGMMANLMPGLLYVVFAIVGIASTNMLSLIYLGVMWKLVNSKLGSSPRDRLLLWRFTTAVCALIVLWQYVMSIELVQSAVDDVPSSPSTARSLLGTNDSNQRVAQDTKQWLSVLPCDKMMLLGYFSAFFVAACQLRMDAILAALEERSRLTIEATRADSAEELDEEMIEHLVKTMVPRRTPTQIALLPARTEESSYLDILFAPLTWEASATWTILEWTRYFYLRYAVDWTLVMVMFFGTFSRDVLHLGYLILPFYFLRAREDLQKDGRMGLRILQLYNVAVIGVVLLYQAPLEALVGDWYASIGSECTTLQLIGLYKLRTVLGWEAGQLNPDLLVFAIVHILRSTIVQRTYDAAMTMRKQSLDADQMMKNALQWGWIRESLKTCLSKLIEKESRRQRVEDIRNEITSLSREILAVESRGESNRKSTGDRKPLSDTLRRRRGDNDEDAVGMDAQDEAMPNIQDESSDKSDAKAAEIRDYEKRMRKNLDDEEKDFTTLLHTWLQDQSSTAGLLFGAFLKAWPWLTAPQFSMCYFFMMLAFAIDFSIVAIVFPTSIIAYGLMAYPSAPAGFWRFILLYSEAAILIAYAVTIPCSMSCSAGTVCDHVDMVFGIKNTTSPFVPSIMGTFMAYVSVMVYCSTQTVRLGDVFGEECEQDDDVDLFAASAIFSRFKRLQFEEIDADFAQQGTTASSLLHINVSSGMMTEFDNFFQRILTQEAEYGPSFVALSILATSDVEPDWSDIGTRVNEALVNHQALENGDTRDSLSYYTLEFVKADPNGLHKNPDHCVAVFRVIAPNSILCPSAEARKAIEALQLREAAGNSEGAPLRITSVRGFHQEGGDFYTATLCFDVLATIFVAMFYQSTVDSDADALVETYFQGLFKIDYVTAVFVLLVLIVVDGVIYMKKAKIAKVFYHYLTYTGYIGFMMLVFYKKTTTHHSYVQFFFLLKSLSFTLGARQIRCGFPSEVLTNSVIFQRSDMISFGAFIAYFSLPFMYELRVLLEYACTDSALDLYDWLKLENISRSLFRINVRNNTYHKYHPFGEPQPMWKKVFFEGGGLFTIIFGLLVVPFFIFSTSNPQVDVNPVFDIRFNMSLVGAQSTFTYPIFDGGFRKTIESKAWSDLRTDGPMPQINKPGQIQEACLAEDSDSVWNVPPPSLAALKTSLEQGAKLTTGWVFKRHLPIDNPILYSDGTNYEFDETQTKALKRILNGEQTSVFLEGIYPRVWHLHGKGAPVPRYFSDQTVSCSLKLNGFNSTSPWWSVECGTYVSERDVSDNGRTKLAWWRPCRHFEDGPEIVLVSSEVPTGVFATFSQFVGGLTGVYVVYILTLSSIVRGFTNNLVGSIQHVDLPSTHRLISLCSDIYSARQVRDFVLEERLYWLLIRIYRSPAVLFEFTRTKDGSAMPLRPEQS